MDNYEEKIKHYIYIYMMYTLFHLEIMLNDFKGLVLSNQNKITYGKQTFRLVPLVFFRAGKMTSGTSRSVCLP